MTYELAKKLKEAKFPQGVNTEQQMLREESDPYELNNRTMWIKYFNKDYLEEMKDKIVYIPTLSELIEAFCGDVYKVRYSPTMSGLNRKWESNEFDKLINCGKYWEAHHFANGGIKAEGSTPEIAVANLWLELNKL